MAASYNDPKVRLNRTAVCHVQSHLFCHILFKSTNTIVINHDNSVYIVNLYTVSICNPMIMSIFLIYYQAPRLGVFNSNVSTIFVQLNQILGGQKIICYPLCKSWGHVPPLPETRSLIQTDVKKQRQLRENSIWPSPYPLVSHQTSSLNHQYLLLNQVC